MTHSVAMIVSIKVDETYMGGYSSE
jgi:hypothetical protein